MRRNKENGPPQQEKMQLLETNYEDQMLELADNNFKAAIITKLGILMESFIIMNKHIRNLKRESKW